jgi:hypothetical protein
MMSQSGCIAFILTIAGVVMPASLLSSPTQSMSRPNGDGPAVVIEWNEITMSAVSTKNGVEQVRLAAITHLAVFEAINAIAGTYEPYLGIVAGAGGASAEAAAVVAAHDVLVEYLEDQSDALGAARDRSLARIPDGHAKAKGIAIGSSAAAALIRERTGDGSTPEAFYDPQSAEPGVWQLTPGCTANGGVFFHWPKVRPFGIESAEQFRSDPPPSLRSRRFARDYNEIRAVGGKESDSRPPDRAEVARFFAAVPSQGVWNPVARQIAASRRLSLVETARLFALLNMAMHDSLVAVLETKYHYTFWRPETAIRAGDTDGNPHTEPDAGFEPFLATPCHPSYPSAHASSSYAAREVLERLLGRWGHAVELSTPALPEIVLRYTSLRRITDDIDDARIYAGIHYRFDQRAGAGQGRRVGEYVVKHTLRPAGHGRRHRW